MILINNQLIDEEWLPEPEANHGGMIYEVLRTGSNGPVFITEHLDRLQQSLKLTAEPIRYDYVFILNELMRIINLHPRREGNVMIRVITGNKPGLHIGFIPHRYPDPLEVAGGVAVATFDAIRDNPNAKTWNPAVRLQANALIKHLQVYEVILKNQHDEITEGSRSNIFWVKNNTLFTPPLDAVLPGITRQKVLAAAAQLNIACEEKTLPLAELYDADEVFITGTSPGVLPVRLINQHQYPVEGTITRKIREIYELMVHSTSPFDRYIPRKETHCVKWDLLDARFGNADALPLWVADMDFETPAFIRNRIGQRLNHPVLGYTIRQKAFNASFVNWVAKLHQWQVDPEWVSFAPGVVSAVSTSILAFTEPGDEIIVQPPVYFPFFSSVQGLGRTLVYNHLVEREGRLCMDFDQLRSVMTDRTRMLILCNPHNPGGSAWTPSELRTLAAICAEHNIRILSDEIHSDLVFEPFRHTPLHMVAGSSAPGIITCMAASKTFNIAGLSTSVVVIEDNETRRQYEKWMHTLHIGMGNIFGAEATMAAYEEGYDWLRQLKEYLKSNRDFLAAFFLEECKGARMLTPEATYLAWIDFNQLNLKQDDLVHLMTQTADLAMNSGTEFGPGGEGFMRLNFAAPRILIEEASRRFKRII